MPQRYSNNASTTLAVAITGTDTTLVVTDSTGFAALASGDTETVTLESGALREIVLVTARAGDAWTVSRAQEGTTAQAWDAGATVEARLTAGALSKFEIMAAYNAPGGNAVGAGSVSVQPARSDADRVASGTDAVAVGNNTRASDDYAVALGYNAVADGYASVSIGMNVAAIGVRSIAISQAEAVDDAVAAGWQSYAMAQYAVTIGCWAFAHADASSAVAIGEAATVRATGAVGVGKWAFASSTAAHAVAVGSSPYAQGEKSVAIGYESSTGADKAVAVGDDATAGGLSSLALGPGSVTDTAHVAHIAALQCHVKPANLVAPIVSERAWRTATLSAPVVTLMSESLNLASTASAIDLVIPPNTRFFVDTVGLIVDAATSPVGTPQISITDLLTAENVTATTQWQRQIWKDRDSAGLAGTLTISVPTALTSGSLTARVYLTGLMVQV